jgi:hypothetical protein
MSHVDDGTLHAYLDGELTPVEREKVDTHLKGCPACQARLAEERALIERASRLLGVATPSERAIPPLEQLRQPRLGWRLRRPLAWAATLILAVGLGWYARGSFSGRAAPQRETETDRAVAAAPAAIPTTPAAQAADSTTIAVGPRGYAATRRVQPTSDSIAKDRDAERRLAATVTTGAASNAIQAQESTSRVADVLTQQKVDAAAQLPPATSAGVTVRGGRAAAPAAAEPQPAPRLYSDGAVARQRAAAVLSTSWPLIARQPAREVLGIEPVIIPGFAVRAYRRNPTAQEIAVEQVTDAGTRITLIERRVDTSADERLDSAAANRPRAMAKAVNERLARFVGPLRVEIDGPLTPDSLSSLLELAR